MTQEKIPVMFGATLNSELLNTIHKPEKLIERIVKASSNEGDLVLDPFAGVGTTLAVCKKIKRNFIGFELNPNFVSITRDRIRKIDLEQKYSLFRNCLAPPFTGR